MRLAWFWLSAGSGMFGKLRRITYLVPPSLTGSRGEYLRVVGIILMVE